MPQPVLRRSDQTSGAGLRAVLLAQENLSVKSDIHNPPTVAEEVKEKCDSFVFDSFTASDAWELGHFLYARLLPLSKEKPTMISICLANKKVLFQCAVGSGTMPDNEIWVERKRNTALRFGTSTWFQHCKYGGREDDFRAKFGLSMDEGGKYAIHGGAVPIRVAGVEGVVAVVIVSGLKQHEDHGVIIDVINRNWSPV